MSPKLTAYDLITNFGVFKVHCLHKYSFLDIVHEDIIFTFVKSLTSMRHLGQIRW